MVRTSKRSTKSTVEQVDLLLPVKDEPASELVEDESQPDEHSFIYSPSRRRTRGMWCVCLPACVHQLIPDGVLTLRCVCVSAKRGESPGPSEESVAPVTRSSRRVIKDASVAPHVSCSCLQASCF